jgi:1-acyl-sn-glycerol-3-phosphate acyltransferase
MARWIGRLGKKWITIVLQGALSVYDHVVFYLGLCLFGLACLIWSLLALVLRPMLPATFGRTLGRAAIRWIFHIFLASLTLSGRFRFDLDALDALKDERSLIIAPNHPSLWDVALIVSRLPDVACIMKAELIGNLFLGGGARLAGYIRNATLRRMVMMAVADLQRGSHLLLFPEGTRTVRQPIGPLTGGIGVIARRAGVAVQTVLIETDSPFLTKGWPVYKRPRLPMMYRVRLGRRFDPPDDSAVFTRELEQYFLHALARPDTPVAAVKILAIH